jgi:DinB superfamily
MFDPGQPATGPELREALGRLLAEGHAFLATLTTEDFFRPQGAHWSPADHVRHLRKSSTPIAAALRLPQILLRIRFGTHDGPSRSYDLIKSAYLTKLAAGGQAGRFAPAPEPAAADPYSRRNEILTRWSAATVSLTNAARAWDEAALDRGQLPHPLLGQLTIREMLAFTVYHTEHHLRRVAERIAPR